MAKYKKLGKTTRKFIITEILINVFLNHYPELRESTPLKSKRMAGKLWRDPFIQLPKDTPQKIIDNIINELNKWEQYNSLILIKKYKNNIFEIKVEFIKNNKL